MDHQGKYPVIFITLKEIVGENIQQVRETLKNLVFDLFLNYEYLKDSKYLS